jgi:hypothetical protein
MCCIASVVILDRFDFYLSFTGRGKEMFLQCHSDAESR